MNSLRLALFALALLLQPALVSRAAIGGIDHVGLTVTHLDASVAFFTDTLGFTIRGGDENYPAVFLGNGEIIITLWRASEPAAAAPFNRKKNVGLHHLAFSVPSFEALDDLHRRLKGALGVTIEFAPELNQEGPAKHMMIREPSGNRIEFIHRPPEVDP